MWSQILAELGPQEVQISESPEATALGAAICAGVAAGVFPDLAKGSRALAQLTALPEPKDRPRSRARYEAWRSWRSATVEANAAASEAHERDPSVSRARDLARSSAPDSRSASDSSARLPPGVRA